MTHDRTPESGDAGDNTDDGLDAWLAAHFPPPPSEPPAGEQSDPGPPPAPPPATPANPSPPAGNPDPGLPAAAPPSAAPPVLPPMAEELEGIPSAPELPTSPTEAFADPHGASGIDDLFGESRFLEYDEGPSPSENPFAKRQAPAAPPHEGERRPRRENKKTQTVLLWVAGSLVAVLALVALFLLGTKLPAIFGPAPGALVAPTNTPTPTPTEVPLGPVDPGTYRWDDLLGGECVDPYDGPWENTYTVVDCEQPHPAQLVTRGTFPEADGGGGYPGIEALQSQVNLLCTAPTVIDYAKANAYTDIQFEASYAVSARDWFDGNHSYFCFLSRSNGGELTGTVAMPQVAPTPTPSEEPAP